MSSQRSFRHGVRRLVRQAGFEIVRKDNATSLLGLHLDLLFERLGVDCVLDVGAKSGEYGVWLRRNGFNGRIVSFEPVSESFAELRQAARGDDEWKVFQTALGSEARELEINVTFDRSFASFLVPTEDSRREYRGQTEIERREAVDVRTLPDMWAEATEGLAEPVVYLKMDTQGWDLDILEGAGPCLAHVPALQTEVAVVEIYEGIASLAESIKALVGYGYYVTGFFPVNVDSRFRLVDVDCVAIRSNEVAP